MSEKWKKHAIVNYGAVWQTIIRDEIDLGVCVAYGDTLEECEKRRDLFAAAPELLEALQGLCVYRKSLDESAIPSIAVIRARAAIAKAEGRE